MAKTRPDYQTGAPTGLIWVICWSWMLCGIVQTLPSSFFPSEAASFGTPDLAIGIIFSAYQTTMIISTPFFVSLTSKLGPWTLIRWSLIGLVICNAIMGTSYLIRRCLSSFIAITVVLRGISGISSCGIMIGGNTYIMKVSPSKELGYNLAVFETAGSVGLCIGPMLGSWLYAMGGFVWAFFGISLLIIPGVVLPSLVEMMASKSEENASTVNSSSKELSAEQSLSKSKNGNEIETGDFGGMGNGLEILCAWTFAKCPYLALLCLDLLFAGMAWTFIDPILERHLSDSHNLTQFHTGLFFGLMSLTYIFATGLVGMAAKHSHNHRAFTYGVMYIGMAVLGGALLMLNINQVSTKVVALGLVGIGQALTYLPIVLALTQTLKDRCKGDVSAYVAGVSQFFVSVGFALGPFIGSQLTSRFSFEATCTFIGLSILLSSGCTVVAMIMKQGWNSKQDEEERYPRLLKPAS
ncbi:hypothetical protein AAMO2058_000740300 [Amorphochlora amoebiformis]